MREVEKLDMGLATALGAGRIGLALTAGGKQHQFYMSPSVAAALAGRIAAALAERGTLLSPSVTDESGVGTGAGVQQPIYPGLQPMPDKQKLFSDMVHNMIAPELAARILRVEIEQVPETGGWIVKDR